MNVPTEVVSTVDGTESNVVPDPNLPLSNSEKEEYERAVLQFRTLEGSWVEGTQILFDIRDRRLYREKHRTFEKFCNAELGITRAALNLRIQRAEIAARLATKIAKPVEKEAHVGPLVALSDPEDQENCYLQALEIADADGKRALRARDVAQAVRARQEALKPPGSATLPEPCQKAETITNIARDVTRGLATWDGADLLRFRVDVLVFKDKWFEANRTKSLVVEEGGDVQKEVTPSSNGNDVRAAGPSIKDVEAHARAVPEVSSKLPAASAPVLVSESADLEETFEVTPAPPAQAIPTICRTYDPAVRFEAIALELPAALSLDELKSLKVNRSGKPDCAVLVRLNGQSLEDARLAIRAWYLCPHAVFTLVPASRPGDPTEHVLLALKGHSEALGNIPREATFEAPEDATRWFEPILSASAAWFGDDYPDSLLVLDAAAVPSLLPPPRPPSSPTPATPPAAAPAGTFGEGGAK